MVKMGILCGHQEILQGLAGARSDGKTTPKTEAPVGPAHTAVAPVPTSPKMLIKDAPPPLGSEMLVPASVWTSVTTDAWMVQRLLALYFCWEYPIFASLSKDYFVKDFCEGRARYCSSILVNSLLSMGSCFSTSSLVGSDGQQASSDLFFNETVRLLEANQGRQDLTTVQALGIMSLRQLSCGKDLESYYYSGQSIRMAIEMGTNCSDGVYGESESAVRAATFWGAYSLDQ